MTDDLHYTLAETYRAGRDAAGPKRDRIEAGLAAVFARLAMLAVDTPKTPAQDAHTPRTAPQTRSGGTDSGEDGGGAQEGGLRVMHCGDMEDHARSYNEGYADGSAGEERARMAIEWLRQVVNAPLSRDTILDIITDALDGPEVIAAEEANSKAVPSDAKTCSNGEVGV